MLGHGFNSREGPTTDEGTLAGVIWPSDSQSQLLIGGMTMGRLTLPCSTGEYESHRGSNSKGASPSKSSTLSVENGSDAVGNLQWVENTSCGGRHVVAQARNLFARSKMAWVEETRLTLAADLLVCFTSVRTNPVIDFSVR